MARGRRTDLPRAALVMEMGKTEGRSENEISRLTGIPAGTIRGILAKAHGWAEIAEEEIFKRHRVEQSRALEQANRSLAARALETAEGKIDQASFSQLTFAAAIMTDKARLLSGESTQNISFHTELEVRGLDQLAEALSQALLERKQGNNGGGNEGNGSQGTADQG